MGRMGRARRVRGNPTQLVDNVNLGWWVAGDLATSGDLDTLQALNATATYNGHAIGNVASLDGSTWRTYVASGDLEMNWSFAERAGDLHDRQV